MHSDIDSQLDVSGMCCPVPLILLAKSINTLESGQTLQITGNDPIFETAVRDFCKANNHAVLEVTSGDNHSMSILIKVGG